MESEQVVQTCCVRNLYEVVEWTDTCKEFLNKNLVWNIRVKLSDRMFEQETCMTVEKKTCVQLL